MSKPILYDVNHTDFNNFGLGFLDAIEAKVREERNGKFELDVVYPRDGRLAKALKINNVIVADAGNVLKKQRFRIARIGKDIRGDIKVHAEHVSYLSQELTVKPQTTALNCNGHQALNAWLASILEMNPFTVSSDISTIASTQWKVPDFTNPRNILGGVRGSILDHWGGEYEFNNYHVALYNQRGRYANTLLAYGRNLTDFEQEQSILETYTSIYPVAVIEEKVHTLPELVVDSAHLSKYPNRRTLLVDFSDEFNEGAAYSDARLRARAQRYITENEVGIPRVSMKLSTLDLTRMIVNGTADHNRIEQLDLCDIVKVYFSKLDIETEAKVTAVTWNVLTDSYDEYQLGDRRPGLSTIIKDGLAQVNQSVSNVQQQAITALISANGKNTNFYGDSASGFPPNPRQGDLFFQKDGDQNRIWQFLEGAWVNLLSGIPEYDFPTAQEIEAEINKQIASERLLIDQEIATAEQAAKDFAEQLIANFVEESPEFEAAINQAIAQAVEKSEEIIGEIAVMVSDHNSKLTAGSLAAINANLGKITAGDIDAALISVYNLNANNISTGTLSAARIGAGSITADKLSVANLAAINANLGTITAGYIDAALVTITNLSATAITTGTLAAARIGASSITADKLSVANLAAISANLGTITAGNINANQVSITNLNASNITSGTINAATINVSNINAANITTGTLNAARIGAGTITANHLAANAIQVGLAAWNDTVRITPTAISFYDGLTMTSQLSNKGLRLVSGATQIGLVGMQQLSGTTGVNNMGIAFDLEYNRLFMSWAYLESSTATTYTQKLSWFRVNSPSGGSATAGLNFSANMNFHNYEIRNPNYIRVADSAARRLRFNYGNLTGAENNAPYLMNEAGSVGLYFGASELYFVRNNIYYRLGDILRGYTWSV